MNLSRRSLLLRAFAAGTLASMTRIFPWTWKPRVEEEPGDGDRYYVGEEYVATWYDEADGPPPPWAAMVVHVDRCTKVITIETVSMERFYV